MTFDEYSLEQAVIELFAAEGIAHCAGDTLQREASEVLLREDLQGYLLERYAVDGIALAEVGKIVRMLEALPSSDLYGSNRTIHKWVADGFALKRENRQKKDLFIELLDYEHPERNRFRLVTQLEVQGYERRIPDGIVYVNGLPLVIVEFKSAVRENATIKDAHTQLTVRYRRDIPELFKYHAFCVISDGVNNKMGSLFTAYDYFYAWRKVNPEDTVRPFSKSL